MVKILSQSGDSLADIYDVEGSIAGIDTLESRELPIVHEMGATIFSERFSTLILREFVDDFGQSTGFNRTVSGIPVAAGSESPFMRILAVAVFIETTATMDLASVSIDGGDGQEIPIWSWDNAVDAEASVRTVVSGGAAGTQIFLRPAVGALMLPAIIALPGQPQNTPSLFFRGISAAFGAGTTQITALVHVAFPRQTGVSARGLPIPSW